MWIPAALSSDEDLIRAARAVALSLARQGSPARAAIVRLACDRLEDLTARDQDTGGGCRRCGAPIDQPATGRPRLYCEACSPRKPRKTPPSEG